MQTDSKGQDWEQALLREREETRDYYLNEFNWRGSPVPEGFDGPLYYPLDEKWRVPARLDRAAPETGEHVWLETSIGDLREFENYGTLVFEVEGQQHRLTAFRAVPPYPDYDYLFVPFRDATTGKETYPAGRYIDIPRYDGETYTLDFNAAYNPSCAYSPRYNCPYPPAQNRLGIPVEAGEMDPHCTY